MTFDAVCALHREALELAIERWCYPAHRWTPVTHPPGQPAEYPADWWVLTDAPDEPGITWQSVPHLHHTATWDRAMALAWAWDVGLVPVGGGRWAVQAAGSRYTLAADTADEARLQIGRLAVWRAMQDAEDA